MASNSNHPWVFKSRRTLVDCEWIRHHIDMLELPSGKTIDFHALEFPMQVAGIIPINQQGQILLTYQYRYMAKRFSWEIPAGNVPEGEDLIDGAHRELVEETGYDCRSLEHIYEYFPQIGRSDHYFNVFVATDLIKITDQIDTDEVFDLKWFSKDEILELIKSNRLCDGFTATAVMAYFLR